MKGRELNYFKCSSDSLARISQITAVEGGEGDKWLKLNIPLHYAARAMGAMTLRISELCLSFSPHPNISDGNVNLVHHFFRIQIFQINGKGPS